MSRFFKQKSVGEEPQLDTLRSVHTRLRRFVEDVKSLRKHISCWIQGIKQLGTSAECATNLLKPNLDEQLRVLGSEVVTGLNEQNGCIERTQNVMNSLDKKLKTMEKLDAKVMKLDQLYANMKKVQKRIMDGQRRGEFDIVSKLSKELSVGNEEMSQLELEIDAKMGYLKELGRLNGGLICKIELDEFKTTQKVFFSRVVKSFEGVSVENYGKTNLDDEFLKFEMSLEARVIQKEKQLAENRAAGEDTSRGMTSSLLPNDTFEVESSPKPEVKENSFISMKSKRKSIGSTVPMYNSLISGFNPSEKGEEIPSESENLPNLQNLTLNEQLHLDGISECKEAEENDDSPKWIAIYNYVPQQEDEIELHENDNLIVLNQSDDGWFTGKNLRTNKTGVFPGNYCEVFNAIE